MECSAQILLVQSIPLPIIEVLTRRDRRVNRLSHAPNTRFCIAFRTQVGSLDVCVAASYEIYSRRKQPWTEVSKHGYVSVPVWSTRTRKRKKYKKKKEFVVAI